MTGASAILRLLYSRLEERKRRRQERGLGGVEYSLNRLAQEVLFAVDPGPCGESMTILLDLIDRTQARAEGKVISSYNVAGKGFRNPQRNGGRDAREDAILAMSQIDAQILRRLSRWRSIQKFLKEEGFAALGRQDAEPNCFACRHPLVDRMDEMLRAGVSAREVADWATAQGHRIGKSVLYEHLGHLQAAVVPAADGQDGGIGTVDPPGGQPADAQPRES